MVAHVSVGWVLAHIHSLSLSRYLSQYLGVIGGRKLQIAAHSDVKESKLRRKSSRNDWPSKHPKLNLGPKSARTFFAPPSHHTEPTYLFLIVVSFCVLIHWIWIWVIIVPCVNHRYLDISMCFSIYGICMYQTCSIASASTIPLKTLSLSLRSGLCG